MLCIAAFYGGEKQANGKTPEERMALRQAYARPVFEDLERWQHVQLPKISGKSPFAKAVRPHCRPQDHSSQRAHALEVRSDLSVLHQRCGAPDGSNGRSPSKASGEKSILKRGNGLACTSGITNLYSAPA
ncbi:MAG: IS66 family transposase [Rhodobacteraceae bacterium]|nr:IS66 family transposase [Paracoccaceae bacterium]